MLAKKSLESFPIPETKERQRSGGGTYYGNFTLPPAQHNPVDSPVYFNALQNLQIILISPIVTDLSDHSSKLLHSKSIYFIVTH